MNDMLSIINTTISSMNYYKHEIKRIENYVEHNMDGNYTTDLKLRMKHYENCMKSLQQDIKCLQKDYNETVCNIYNI